MVVKKRSNSNDRFILPLTNEYKEKENMKTVVLTTSQHHLFEVDTPSASWRRWSSNDQLFRSSQSKKFDTLPSWGNPQDDFYECAQPKSRMVITTRRKRTDVWSLLTFCLVLIGGITCRHLKSELNTTLIKIKTVLAHRNQLKIQLRAKDKDVRMLSREIAATKQRVEVDLYARLADKSVKRLSDSSALKGMKEAVDSYSDRKKSLKEHVQERSRKSVETTYGIGNTLRVQFTLDFPDDMDGPNTFTIEMASLESMPHAVFTFLSMVEEGLWDGCSFLTLANQVMKAVPVSYDETRTPAQLAKAFRKANLNGPVLKEYNDDFLHSPYTFGFVGRGSPSFYISAENNADLHPSDAAFGKLVDGFDTLARMNSHPADADSHFADRVGIKSTKIQVSSNRSLRLQKSNNVGQSPTFK